MDKDQLREALDYSATLKGMHNDGHYAGQLFKAAQAHLKLLDGIEGLRVDDTSGFDRSVIEFRSGAKAMYEAVMKLMEE